MTLHSVTAHVRAHHDLEGEARRRFRDVVAYAAALPYAERETFYAALSKHQSREMAERIRAQADALRAAPAAALAPLRGEQGALL